MDADELEILKGEVDALARSLAEERFRHVAGLEPRPALRPIFAAHGSAAHRETVAALRAQGEAELARRVAVLRAERSAAEEEEQWRAAESAASCPGPDGPVSLAAAELGERHEANRSRRLALGRAAASAIRAAAPHREAAAEARARSHAESGLSPPWEDVVEADAVLNASEDAYRDGLSWLAARADLAPAPAGDLERADLLHLLALRTYDGLFRRATLAPELDRAFRGLGLDASRVRLDGEDRAGKWPGAHAHEGRVSLARQGGAADWLGLFAAAGAAVAAGLSRPATRDPAFPAAIGALASSLLLEPRFLAAAVGVERRQAPDLVRALAVLRLFELRARAAALRVAAEVERGTSGAAWREAHREALSAAALASWPDGLAARDADADLLRASLRGAAWGEALRRELTERLDEDFWRNPRTAPAIAGMLAVGAGGPGTEKPPLAVAAGALVKRIERGA